MEVGFVWPKDNMVVAQQKHITLTAQKMSHNLTLLLY